MERNINKTIEFLKEQFDKSTYMSENKKSKEYRLKHTMRVAYIGKEIAKKESLDEEALIIGCLLHDISYIKEFNSEEDWLNHGRCSANIAKPFLETLELSKKQIDEICYGISIHVDDKSDLSGERTPTALSIGDSDNIDRFDVFRIHENLNRISFTELPYQEQIDYVTKVLDKLYRYKSIELGTKVATDIWSDKISFQIQFYERLKSQLESSNFPL